MYIYIYIYTVQRSARQRETADTPMSTPVRRLMLRAQMAGCDACCYYYYYYYYYYSYYYYHHHYYYRWRAATPAPGRRWGT